jgi:polysaccharide export outer membrane protein
MQMKSLEPSPDEEYTLDGGDTITVTVPGHPELSGQHVVGPDGRISLPTAGTVNLKDLTREQAADVVQKAYGQYFRDPSASISIDKYGSNRVLVMGAVQHQGYVTFDHTPTLLEALSQAGLAQPTAPGGVQTVANTAGRTGPVIPALPQTCTVYEGTGPEQKIVTVNLRQLFSSGNPMADVRLRRHAIIYVPNPRDRFVSVLGEVTHPGPVELTDDMNLPTLLGYAGGATERAGNNPNIAIIDPSTTKVRYIHFRDLTTPEHMNEIALKPGDLVVVQRAGLAKLGYTFQQISPMTGIASILAFTAF